MRTATPSRSSGPQFRERVADSARERGDEGRLVVPGAGHARRPARDRRAPHELPRSPARSRPSAAARTAATGRSPRPASTPRPPSVPERRLRSTARRSACPTWTGHPSDRLERCGLAPGDLDERRAADDAVAPRELVDELRIRLATAADAGKVGAESSRPATRASRRSSGGRRAARRRSRDDLGVMPRAVSSWTRSTSRRSRPVSVSGSTPWPRLKTWPGRPPASASTARAPASVASQPARSARRVEVALDAAVVARSRRQASASETAMVDADDVAARLGHQLQQRRRPGPEVDRRDVARAPRRCARDVGLHELAVVGRAEAADPAVEELDDLARRPRPAPAGTRRPSPTAAP